MHALRVPQSVRERLGQDATIGLVDLFDANGRQWSDDMLSTVGQQINAVGERLERRTAALEDRISQLEHRISEDASAIRVDMHKELAGLRVEWLRWSFLFWIGQVAALAGLMATLLRAAAR